MGLDYSLCIVTRREKANELLQRLSYILDEDNRARLDKLIWSPESESTRCTKIGVPQIDARGISGLARDGEFEFENSYCLSLEIQLEPEMDEVVGDHHLECFDQPGSFGCMWTSVFAGAEYLLLEMTAATTGMSIVLEKSEVIHTVWTDLAKQSEALFAFVDLEDEIALQLFPDFGDMSLPDYDTLSFEGDYRQAIDLMTRFLIDTNKA